ncbi:MAG: hypothetical protein A3C90_03095 [Candidatus Magasanikbacteria bacterium RIFCSPHIGHO2_02_FULL_51_14]|uniref:Rrf2 family transcriptional regulator n=1 Tax=Candidatus Magasanikbacteria bacterium RIFCSPHIGHO2_02_FULL_51_14 TaxID=1798683 RepID=A0A1F6MHW0_9BACT|nr:MAG: hypothetical protein A3C90_03095 [Candidatus Magasanikbacteria bacterium RIFCSPHIGHO2_02_FULL_51_14]
MLQFSKRSDYALQLLIALSRLGDGEYLGLRQFSKESSISFLFLQRIARSLRLSGLIGSKQGARGGYCLMAPRADVTLRDIVEAVEGPVAIVSCLKDGNRCPLDHACASRTVFTQIRGHVLEYIDDIRLSDLAEKIL